MEMDEEENEVNAFLSKQEPKRMSIGCHEDVSMIS